VSRPGLLFVVESPFSERDRRRFGIEELAWTFDISVIDTTPVVAPSIWQRLGRIQVADERVATAISHGELVRLLSDNHFDAVVSILGIHEQRHAVYAAARDRHTLTIELQLGTLPGDDLLASKTMTKFATRWKQLTDPLQSVSLLLDKVRRRRYRSDVPALVVCGGNAARRRLQERVGRFIEAHSLDYDLFVQRRDGSPSPDTRPTAVYLDQDLGFHADNEHSRLRSPITPERYYPELLGYLRHFEALTGLEVVIAPHPRANPEVLRDRFPGFTVSREPTIDLVRSCTCVLAHVSTAISFAVLWRKPLLLLGGPQLMHSWYEPYISAFAESLGRSVVDTSTHDSSALTEIERTIDPVAYEAYVSEYLSARVDDGRRLWDIVGAAILEELDRPR
jgi:hypothetical protein